MEPLGLRGMLLTAGLGLTLGLGLAVTLNPIPPPAPGILICDNPQQRVITRVALRSERREGGYQYFAVGSVRNTCTRPLRFEAQVAGVGPGNAVLIQGPAPWIELDVGEERPFSWSLGGLRSGPDLNSVQLNYRTIVLDSTDAP
jgi:hypothetical protein